ncbi:MAG: hypothetical protein SFU86_14470 [Pirellulaceae bacterium]|nr:hypothetical protein [Pirellulaceae bacterium]
MPSSSLFRGRVLFPLQVALLGCALLPLAGCGNKSLAPVKGKVVSGGQPVTEGGLLFTPLAAGNTAAPATGIIQPDGTFTLGTEGERDGAAIGKHQVKYTPPQPTGPEWDGYGTPPAKTYSPFHGFVPKETEVEIKAGENELTIELVKP